MHELLWTDARCCTVCVYVRGDGEKTSWTYLKRNHQSNDLNVNSSCHAHQWPMYKLKDERKNRERDQAERAKEQAHRLILKEILQTKKIQKTMKWKNRNTFTSRQRNSPINKYLLIWHLFSTEIMSIISPSNLWFIRITKIPPESIFFCAYFIASRMLIELSSFFISSTLPLRFLHSVESVLCEIVRRNENWCNPKRRHTHVWIQRNSAITYISTTTYRCQAGSSLLFVRSLSTALSPSDRRSNVTFVLYTFVYRNDTWMKWRCKK